MKNLKRLFAIAALIYFVSMLASCQSTHQCATYSGAKHKYNVAGL